MKLWELEKGKKICLDLEVAGYQYIKYDGTHFVDQGGNSATGLVNAYFYDDHWEYYEEPELKTNKEIIQEIEFLLKQLKEKLCVS